MLSTLPRAKGWMTEYIFQFLGIWLSPGAPKNFILVNKLFKSLPPYIFLATTPKAGTTWFKVIIFAIVHRSNINSSTNPLLIDNPNNCVPFLEISIDQDPQSYDSFNHLEPRVLATHIPYFMLPNSIRTSSCRIVYVFRDPKDVFVSQWHRPKELPPLSLEEAFVLICGGNPTGDHIYWDHVLGFWKMALESQEKVLFLTYEDMKRTPLNYMQKLAEFIGMPFTKEEDANGLPQEIVNMCSFEKMSNLQVNKFGVHNFSANRSVDHSDTFRKGEIGGII